MIGSQEKVCYPWVGRRWVGGGWGGRGNCGWGGCVCGFAGGCLCVLCGFEVWVGEEGRSYPVSGVRCANQNKTKI